MISHWEKLLERTGSNPGLMITYSTTNLLEFKKGCVLMNVFGEECRTDPETKDGSTIRSAL